MAYQSILNAIIIVNATYIYGNRHFIDLEKHRDVVCGLLTKVPRPNLRGKQLALQQRK
jgi:hypothetical protein